MRGIKFGFLFSVPLWVALIVVVSQLSGCGALTSKGLALDASLSLHGVDEQQQSSKMVAAVRPFKCIFVQCPETSEQGS